MLCLRLLYFVPAPAPVAAVDSDSQRDREIGVDEDVDLMASPAIKVESGNVKAGDGPNFLFGVYLLYVSSVSCLSNGLSKKTSGC